MSRPFWLIEVQMGRLYLFFPKCHGKPLHDGRSFRPDRPHSQHHNQSRMIIPSCHPGTYTSLTDATDLEAME
uniref:Transposase, truncated n=1 Tax=Paracoccus yeei TaxID=147645 RepID=A0A0D5A0S0_9RHOB|nr:transposase, truncated [Paracoccus yeei]